MLTAEEQKKLENMTSEKKDGGTLYSGETDANGQTQQTFVQGPTQEETDRDKMIANKDVALKSSMELVNGNNTNTDTTNRTGEGSEDQDVKTLLGGIIPEESQDVIDERNRQAAIAEANAKAEIDEDKLRTDTENKFQSEIDVTNRMFAERMAEAERAGDSRLGSTGAIQSRRGLLGSSFGEAQTQKIRDVNQAVFDTIDDQQTNALVEVYKDINKEIDAELKEKQASIEKGGVDYLAYLVGEDTRKKDKINKTIANIIKGEVEPSEELYEDLADKLGTTVDNIKQIYEVNKKSYDEQIEAQEQANLTAQEQADRTARGEEADIAKTGAETDKLGAEALTKLESSLLDRDKFEELKKQGVIDQSWEEYLQTDKEYNASVDTELDIAKQNLEVAKFNETQRLNTVKIDEINTNILKKMTEIEQIGKTDPLTAEKKQKEIDVLNQKLGEAKKKKNDELIQKGQIVEIAKNKAAEIQGILDDPGLENAVGPNSKTRTSIFEVFTAERSNFIAMVKQLTAQETMDTLTELKDRGGTLGALSDQERIMLANAAVLFNSWAVREKDADGNEDPNGKVIGYETTEGRFEEELLRLKTKTEEYQKNVQEYLDSDEGKAEMSENETVNNDNNFNSIWD